MLLNDEIKVLLVEDNKSDYAKIEQALKSSSISFNLNVVNTSEHFISSLNSLFPDVIVSNLNPHESNTNNVLNLKSSRLSDVPLILLVEQCYEEEAIKFVSDGADDYVVKNNLNRLPIAIKNAISKYYAYREKRELQNAHSKLSVAYNQIEENNKSMTDSINYAKLIQEAMLPEKAVLTNYFPNSLIIFRPKDIVSGDFYWFVERDNKLFIAVADCTGHGVPGSLMSMIGYSLLNEIVDVKKVRQPAEILNKLNKGIRRTLKQDKIGNQRCDGMDIALCCINRQSQQIEYAGANRHLVYFRDKTLELIKGNKFGIGGLHDESNPEFTNHKFSYDEGDIIYMCTDGYADQFGGTKGKRMMTKNMNKILEKSLSFGVAEQEQLLNHWLDKWQGNYEQTDDILLIGIQL